MAIIAPLVAETIARRGAIQHRVWHHPYVVGLMISLITGVARLETRDRIDGERLARVQLDAWWRITGVRDERIGEDICLLSAARNDDFLAGWRDGERLLSEWLRSGRALAPSNDGSTTDPLRGGEMLDTDCGVTEISWIALFDGFLERHG